MNFMRMAKHFATTHRSIRQRFPESSLAEIKHAIMVSEQSHRGEIRVAIEAALQPSQLWQDMSPRERALELFASMHVWDTVDNSGVLIYILLADRSIEIVADRGVCPATGNATWRDIADAMRKHFASGSYTEGTLAGVEAVSRELAALVPENRFKVDELPDDVTLL